MPFCIKCGSSLGDKSKFCGKCGTPVGASSTLVCLNCNTPIKIGDKFCAKCGSPLPGMLFLFCKNCNSKLAESDKFCIKCGTPVNSTSSSDVRQNVAAADNASAIEQAAIDEKKKADAEYEAKKEAAVNEYKNLLNDNTDSPPEQMLERWATIGKLLYGVYELTRDNPERESDAGVLKEYLDDSKSRAEKYISIIELRKFDEDCKVLFSDFKTNYDNVQTNGVVDEYNLLSEFEELYGRVNDLVEKYYSMDIDDADGSSLAELQSDIAYCYCCLLYAMNRYENSEGEKLGKQQIKEYNARCSEISSAFEQYRFYALCGLSTYKLYLSCADKDKQDPDDSESGMLSDDRVTLRNKAKTSLKAINNRDYCFKVSTLSSSEAYFDIAEWENAANGLIRLFKLLINDDECSEAYELSQMVIASHAAATSRNENKNAKRLVDSFDEKQKDFTIENDGTVKFNK